MRKDQCKTNLFQRLFSLVYFNVPAGLSNNADQEMQIASFGSGHSCRSSSGAMKTDQPTWEDLIGRR